MMLQMLYQWPEVKCRLWTYRPDLWTGKWLGSVLGFMLRVRVVTVSIGVKIKVRVSSSILPYCRSAGPHFTRGLYQCVCNTKHISQPWL